MKFLSLLFLFFFSGISLHAQIEGLWAVQKVQAGDQLVTPVAKWFQFEADQQVFGGNGGVRNTTGTFEYDASTQSLLFFDEKGEADEMGAFKVSWEGDILQWQRKEAGMDITVHLKKVNALPLAPWDKIVGLWKWREGKDWHHMFLRWDREFRLRSPATIGGTRLTTVESGIWHIHGHRPHLRLLSNKGDANDSQWEIRFEGEDRMIWKSLDDGDDTERVYVRI